MGYTSHVVLAVKEEVQTPELSILNGADKSWYVDGYRYYEWLCVKWYDSFEEIKALNDWLDDLDVADREEDYYMLILGEELDDVTSRGWSYDAQIWRELICLGPHVEAPLFDYKTVVIGFLVIAVLVLL